MPQEPESVDKKRPSPGLFSSQHGDYKRLFREYKTFQIELDLLEKRTSKNKEPWLAAAKAQLKQVDSFLGNGKKKRDNEGGWVCLHAAKRHAIYGLEDNELSLQASILRKEATKIVGWRADAIKEQLQLLDKDDHLTPARIINAMSLRDEYFSNQYHKIWMVGDQLRLLIVICGVGLILLVPLVFLRVRYSGRARGSLVTLFFNRSY